MAFSLPECWNSVHIIGSKKGETFTKVFVVIRQTKKKKGGANICFSMESQLYGSNLSIKPHIYKRIYLRLTPTKR